MTAQRFAAAVALLVLSPLLIVLAVVVKRSSPGPVLYRATRVSRGRPFAMLKFRTMAHGSGGAGVTMETDRRVTAVGVFLRRTRLDELPQLVNVVRGDMALVGPRPEDPRYVDWSDPEHRFVFGARPGIAGPTALDYRDEGALIEREARAIAREAGRVDPKPEDVDRAYRERILPGKVALDAAYLRSRTRRRDLAVLARTFGLLLGAGRRR